jgi:hypothetical protein
MDNKNIISPSVLLHRLSDDPFSLSTERDKFATKAWQTSVGGPH